MGRCKQADCNAWEFEQGYCRTCIVKIKKVIEKKFKEDQKNNLNGGTLLTGGSLNNSHLLGSKINSIDRYSNIELIRHQEVL